LDAWHFFKGVVENLEDAIAVLDKEGNAIYKNKRMKKINFKIQDHWKKPPKTPIHINRIDNRYFTGWIIPLYKKIYNILNRNNRHYNTKTTRRKYK